MGDEKYPGYDRITTILNYFSLPEYVKWAVKVGTSWAKHKATAAKNIGRNVDEWIKADIKGEKLPKLATNEAKNCIEGYKLWRKEFGIIPVVASRMFDKETRITGEPDLVANNTIIDIKCSSEIRSIYWLQTEWYARKSALSHKAILRLDKHLGVYEYDQRPLSQDAYDAVSGLIAAYRFYQHEQSLTERREDEDVNDTDSTHSKTGIEAALEEPEISDDRPKRNW